MFGLRLDSKQIRCDPIVTWILNSIFRFESNLTSTPNFMKNSVQIQIIWTFWCKICAKYPGYPNLTLTFSSNFSFRSGSKIWNIKNLEKLDQVQDQVQVNMNLFRVLVWIRNFLVKVQVLEVTTYCCSVAEYRYTTKGKVSFRVSSCRKFFFFFDLRDKWNRSL